VYAFVCVCVCAGAQDMHLSADGGEDLAEFEAAERKKREAAAEKQAHLERRLEQERGGKVCV